MQLLRRRIFLLTISSILLIFILFYYSFGTYTEISVEFDPQSQQKQQSTLNVTSEEKDEEPFLFSKSETLNITRKPSKDVIAFLVASFTGDARLAYNPYPKLRERMAQLDKRLGDDNGTDVIIFHTGYPFRGDIQSIIDNSKREVIFVNIDYIFYQFSPGFQPHITDPTWSQKGKWHFHHICYFWFKQVFQLKIIQRYRYMMKIDDDSQILGKWPNIFEIMTKQNAVYMANKKEADNEYLFPGLTLIRNLTTAFIAQQKISPRNTVMLATALNSTIEIPHFSNHFEVIDILFMQRNEVVDFIDAVDDSKGIFLYRWGDAPLRYITLALFANQTQIIYREKLGLYYCHPC